MDNFIDEGFFDITQTWDQTIGGSTCVIVKNRQDREWLESVNPLWYQSLKGAGVDSIVLFPLIYNENTLGYMWALNFNEESTVKIKETLELTTFFIASEIANYQLLQRLEQQADKANISISVGTYVVHEGEDIRNAMRAADEMMYNDKKEYYDKQPEKRYR
ncbi:MAG: hypothetical protein SPL61_13145 [Saccharofermentans sp.]|nr:hypothetical protein [Saccharofermentans sp.]